MAATTKVEDASRRKHLPLYVLIVSGCLFILAGVALSLARDMASPARVQPSSSNLPQQIAGLPLTSTEGGPAALAEIENMHGQGFALTGGEVAHYGDATLWVARTSDASDARAMTDSMTTRIAEGRSPFQPTGSRQVDEHTVYTLTGMGQSHFYWQAGDQVAWLAIATAKSEQGLRETLAALDRR